MYFEPEMEVLELQLQGMLCVSGGDIDEETGEAPYTPGDKY